MARALSPAWRGVVPARRPEVSTAYLMAGGALLLIALFTLYPFGYALFTSAHVISPILPRRFVGLANYHGVLTSPYFAASLLTTARFALVTVPAILLIGLLVALLLDRRFPGNGVVRVAILLPWTIPAAIAGVIWTGVFADSWGALNAVLFRAGLIQDYVRWLTEPHLAFAAAAVAQVWAQFPLAAVFLLAAIQAIPDELYEAAALDGAGGWRRFTAITLPYLRPMLVVVALFEVLVALTAFDLIFALTGGGPGTATAVLSYFIYSETFRMLSFGTGAALAVTIALLAVVVIVGLLRLMPREALLGEEGAA